ncbi:sulfite exporter TauE/SafE family protein [Embleya sp. NBC_00896]|uniref:sulfite exporter TauE/SafE family protein n=1 Tax=Embleya sp. NBC_00896 TaxID=2975961 RepID=UPI00386764A1|nr:sulfite exporter TauE/SafE family protein [Embleya sp. NBC_00896]
MVLVAVAGLLAGLVNAIAGGGSLISFPALLAVGYPPVTANVTNAVAVLPGYVGGTVAYRHEVRRQTRRLPRLALVGALGGLTGAVLLLISPEDVFHVLAPYLVLLSCAVLAFQPALARVVRRGDDKTNDDDGGGGGGDKTRDGGILLPLTQFVVGVYGGYFGAGIGIMMLAVLGLLLDDDLHEVNALKNALSLVVGITSTVFFAFFGPIQWAAAAVMAVTSLVGGHLGVRIARRLPARGLRTLIVTFGAAVAIALWL